MTARLSGWCSPDCGPRAHGICQDRQDRGLLDACSCIRHGGHTTPEDAA